ncbi:hypothetical protein Cpha266_1208 [Chlorobium phaeobacteroides DSM 266]|uniref:Uncharacterized protein n=1 Tax=Chlorobium phaeobacteroides (strain DSM 266 / SMG 266 / 2430) TaxID=290317 RepID=A1BFR6_CHLPD|nr:hypothetical protein Cpha266_1208 [Chlorobium phaeobacteroides DSM 266]
MFPQTFGSYGCIVFLFDLCDFHYVADLAVRSCPFSGSVSRRPGLQVYRQLVIRKSPTDSDKICRALRFYDVFGMNSGLCRRIE